MAQFGLDCKDLEQLENRACVLGLDVRRVEGTLQWKWGSMVSGIPEVLMRRTVFSRCGKLVGQLPVCGWLHTAVGIIKHRANVVTSGWDNHTSDALLSRMIAESVERATHEDPAQGEWCVNGEEMNVWVDASLLALGVLLEKDVAMLKDAC